MTVEQAAGYTVWEKYPKNTNNNLQKTSFLLRLRKKNISLTLKVWKKIWKMKSSEKTVNMVMENIALKLNNKKKIKVRTLI